MPHSLLSVTFCSAQIAAALDAILARELDSADTKQAAANTTPTSSTPALQAAADDAEAASTGVRLFRKVAKGTPCRIQLQPCSAGVDDAHKQQAASLHSSSAAVAFGSGSLPRTRPMRHQIARLNRAAEHSRQAGKRKHEQVLAELTVEGGSLLAAAAAAGYGKGGVNNKTTGAAAGVVGNNVSNKSSSSTSATKAITTTTAWVKGWKRLKGQKAQGVVVEAKEFVPYDVRAAKLVGSRPATLCLEG